MEIIECDCTTEVHADGKQETHCGSAQMMREVERLRDALGWYAEMAKMMQRASLHVDNQVALHILKELALDGGKRARAALPPNGQAKGRA